MYLSNQRHFLLCIILLSLLFTFCNNKGNENDVIVKSIIDIHTPPFNTNLTLLKNTEKIINQYNDLIPDSIKAENDYLIGEYWANKNLDSAAIYFSNAAYHLQNKIQTNRQINCFYIPWNIYIKKGEFGECQALIDKFQTLVEEEKNSRWLHILYYFKEQTYLLKKSTYDSSDLEKALKYNQLRLDLLKKGTLDFSLALKTKAEITSKHLKDNKKAIKIIIEALQNYDGKIQGKDKNSINDFFRQVYGDYGVYLFKENLFDEALVYYLKGLEFTKKAPNQSIGKKSDLANGYSNIAEVYMKLGKYGQAQTYIDSVWLQGKDNIDIQIQKNTREHQLKLLILKDPSNTIEIENHLDTIHYYNDKDYDKKYNKELAALKIESKKREMAIQAKNESNNQIKKRTNLLYFSIVVIIFLAIIGFFLYRQRKFKFERESLLLQQQLLSSQMNPHFTFNILYAIKNLIKKDKEKASQYLLKFSRLLRLILENSMMKYVQLNKELESLEEYLALQLFRFPSKFTYSIILDNIEREDFIFIPPMLIQPIVENCIEHGFPKSNNTGNIILTLSKKGKHILCSIEDNGIGFHKNRNLDKLSISTKLISTFVEKTTNTKVEFINKKDIRKGETGVIVRFLITYKTDKYD